MGRCVRRGTRRLLLLPSSPSSRRRGSCACSAPGARRPAAPPAPAIHRQRSPACCAACTSHPQAAARGAAAVSLPLLQRHGPTLPSTRPSTRLPHAAPGPEARRRPGHRRRAGRHRRALPVARLQRRWRRRCGGARGVNTGARALRCTVGRAAASQRDGRPVPPAEGGGAAAWRRHTRFLFGLSWQHAAGRVWLLWANARML